MPSRTRSAFFSSMVTIALAEDENRCVGFAESREQAHELGRICVLAAQVDDARDVVLVVLHGCDSSVRLRDSGVVLESFEQLEVPLFGLIQVSLLREHGLRYRLVARERGGGQSQCV